MAKLSLREIKQSQLDAAPVVDGQLVFCTDTGNLYRDVGSARIRAGSDIEIVSELPLAPIEGKVYCLRDGDMWLYEGGDWLKLNQSMTELKDVFAAKNHTHSDKVDNTETGANGLLTKLTTSWSAAPTDDTYFIRQDTGGGNTFGRLKFSTVWTYIKGKADSVYQPKGSYAASSHTHNYAGSTSAGGSAISAVKLDTATAGSATQPVYFSGGKPVATTYTLGKSVPADAVFTDTVYSHPTSSGNKHIPSGGSAGQFLKWSADGTAVWAADNNTTYNNATQSSAGLMSSTDKKKLDSVNMANACMYDGTSTGISEMQSTCDYIDGGAY